jgi:hypothetical protein
MQNYNFERLTEIREQMMELLEEAKNIIRQDAPRHTYERAKAYWIGHIDTALGGGNYVDTYDVTFEKTLNEIPVESDEDEEESDMADGVGYSVKDGALYHSMYPDDMLGEFQDGGFVPSKFLLELPPECHELAQQHADDYMRHTYLTDKDMDAMHDAVDETFPPT